MVLEKNFSDDEKLREMKMFSRKTLGGCGCVGVVFTGVAMKATVQHPIGETLGNENKAAFERAFLVEL
jgi:hypothetical protein